MVYRIQPRQRSATSPAGAPPSARELAARRRARIQPPNLTPTPIEAPAEMVALEATLDVTPLPASAPVAAATPVLDLTPQRFLADPKRRQAPSGALVLSLLGHVALGLALYYSPGMPEDARGEPAIEVTFVEEAAPVGDAEADARAAPEPEVAVDMPPDAEKLMETPPDIPPPDPLPEVEVAPPEPVPPVEIPSEPVVETPPPEIDVPPPEPVTEQPVIEPLPSEPEPDVMKVAVQPPPEPKPEPPKPEAKRPPPVKKPAPRKVEVPKPRAAAPAVENGENRANRTEGRAASGGAGGRSSSAVASWRSQVQAAIVRNKPAPNDDREGVVRVGFTVARNGGVSNVRVTASAGAAALDAAALAAVRRASPLPSVPEDMDAPISLEVPIRFQIN